MTDLGTIPQRAASDGEPLELSIVMPCLNEAETLAVCIEKAQSYLATSGIAGEVIVADNGSTDGSQAIAESLGARVVPVARKGYGSALLGGIAAARGRFVIMGDADDSYDFLHLDPFVEALRSGSTLVMGNRFRGGIEPGAMPFLHKYLGNPVLSWIGRLFFRIPVRDFHCGLRGFDRQAALDLGLVTTGMEFASEMVVRFSLAGQPMTEVPTRLAKDGRSRPPHLRTWTDGWRHLRFLLMFSPTWLFLLPGFVAAVIGLLGTLLIAVGPLELGAVTLDVSSLVYFSGLTVVGYQAGLFAFLSKLYAAHEGFLPPSRRFSPWLARFTVERGVLVGLALFVIGVGIGIAQVADWARHDFGALDASETIRLAVPAALALMMGVQTIMASMYAGLFSIAIRASDAEADE
ncbi:glycosyltransferase family 2 protein [Galbitalea sp. SE-J8]|uniref:glycosyltransferase family 2 protein n=1 Tax=Galbitalea sp. SE-J8 TaxID=3054952 RepID=UPI00259CCB3C|nr:glycosyltransferase family 2 protein [Galbitalea sp. SE-J8]MDM4762950.1 glycosyltransferase family 2 protein [Galbitalea sp. SE-J8]